MKTILSSLLVLSVSAGLAACGGTEDETGTSVSGLRACLPGEYDVSDEGAFVLDLDGDGVRDCLANRYSLARVDFASATKYARQGTIRLNDRPARWEK